MAKNNNNLDEIYYYHREKQEVLKEVVLGDGFIKWAYQTMSGKLFNPLLYNFSFLSAILGKFFDSKLSKGRIAKVIAELDIDMSEVEKQNFETFNDFFYRKLRKEVRPFNDDNHEICSPADGRVLVYPELAENTTIKVKGAESNIADLFAGDFPEFEGGSVAVVRLCPADYHRFHFPCSGVITQTKKIKGQFHSVNPVALESVENVFVRNKREYSIIENPVFGKVGYLEVGAFGVAGIEQTWSDKNVQKMDEKGYFKFGGSTVVLVFEKNKIEFTKDLLENSAKGMEVLLKVGTPLGTSKQG